jgi:hypothetical protein
MDAVLRVPPADWVAIPPNLRQATLRKFKKLGDELIANLNVRLQDASERGKDLEAILRDIRRQEREQAAFVQEVERFRGVISDEAQRSGADLDFLEQALAVDQAVLSAYRSCRRELEDMRRRRLQEYISEWLAYLSRLKEKPEYAALAPKIEEFWQWVSRKLWAPEATPTDEGFLLIWDRDEHHLQVELLRDGSYDWFYRNRDKDTVSYEEGLSYGRWTTRFQEVVSRLRG